MSTVEDSLLELTLRPLNMKCYSWPSKISKCGVPLRWFGKQVPLSEFIWCFCVEQLGCHQVFHCVGHSWICAEQVEYDHFLS